MYAISKGAKERNDDNDRHKRGEGRGDDDHRHKHDDNNGKNTMKRKRVYKTSVSPATDYTGKVVVQRLEAKTKYTYTVSCW